MSLQTAPRGRWPRALALRLALMFALVSALLFGAVGLALFPALDHEIRTRDDVALMARVQRMRSLIGDSASIAALKERPTLYENMLGNRESLLFVLAADGTAVIEINPTGIGVPHPPAAASVTLADGPLRSTHAGPDASSPTPAPGYRLAWQTVDYEGRPLTLIAGILTANRDQMLATYRFTLLAALLLCCGLAFVLGWWVSVRGLRPVRALARQALAVDAQHLHVRLHGFDQLGELQALSGALNQMLARLEAGFTQLSRFSEDLAHEMRTPLANLMGQTQWALQRPRTTAEYEELLASATEEYERLARMIDNMLFLARAEQPQTAIAREPVALHAMVEQLCEYFEGTAEEAGIRLVNRAQGNALADPGLLRRALANLLANALRYGSTGSVVTIATVPGGGGHRRDGGEVGRGDVERGEVDRGDGAESKAIGAVELRVHNQCDAQIAADELPRLFDRFYRRDPSRATQGDSGGLGLAIVRSITQLHGGSVWAQVDDAAADAPGITFGLCVPAAEAP